MEQTFMPRLLLIAGTGRNSGKTTFACDVISFYNKLYPLVALKISSHFHKDTGQGNVIVNRPNLFISEETQTENSKDSSLMLQSGARKSYFIMAADEQLTEALCLINSFLNPNDFIICESGGLRKYVKPGVFLVFHNLLNKHQKEGTDSQKELCDRFVTFNGTQTDFDVSQLLIENNRWTLASQI